MIIWGICFSYLDQLSCCLSCCHVVMLSHCHVLLYASCTLLMYAMNNDRISPIHLSIYLNTESKKNQLRTPPTPAHPSTNPDNASLSTPPPNQTSLHAPFLSTVLVPDPDPDPINPFESTPSISPCPTKNAPAPVPVPVPEEEPDR